MVEHYPGTTPVQSGGGTQGSTQVTEQAKQQSQQLADQARQQAGDLANRGTERAKGQLANQKHEASDRKSVVEGKSVDLGGRRSINKRPRMVPDDEKII